MRTQHLALHKVKKRPSLQTQLGSTPHDIRKMLLAERLRCLFQVVLDTDNKLLKSPIFDHLFAI